MQRAEIGIGTRVFNFLVDTFLIFWIAYWSYQIGKWWTFFYHVPYFNFGWHFLWSLVGYYFLFEWLFKRTPGKWCTFTKIVSCNGKKVTVVQILLRTIVRLSIIDCFFIPFFQEPLHDYLSRTTIVEK
ncbi:MAG: RDD family protein [Phycisphaerales bacterium]|nr:RDD family protein [Phycisphaerales bacterium]